MYNNDIIITMLNIYITSYVTRSKYMILFVLKELRTVWCELELQEVHFLIKA